MSALSFPKLPGDVKTRLVDVQIVTLGRFGVGFLVGLRARDFSTERVRLWTPFRY